MSSEKKKENVHEIESDEDEIKHSYFDRTPSRDWKAVDALAYYKEQGASLQEAYDLVENALNIALKSRKKLEKCAQAFLQELNVRTIASS